MLGDRFKKTTYIAIGGKREKKREEEAIIPVLPEGLWIKCEGCGQMLYREDWTENWKVCPKCGLHGRMTARERLIMLADESSFREWDKELEGKNPLQFPDYEKKLAKAKEATGLVEAVVTGEITIYGTGKGLYDGAGPGYADLLIWLLSLWKSGQYHCRGLAGKRPRKAGGFYQLALYR